MPEAWASTQDHEASHIVIAWIRAYRIEVIGDLYVALENGRRVTVAGVRADPHLISSRNAAVVGVAGFLGEARGNVYRALGEAQIVGGDGIAAEVVTTLRAYPRTLAVRSATMAN